MLYNYIDTINYNVLVIKNDSNEKICVYQFSGKKLTESNEILCNQGPLFKIKCFEDVYKNPMVLSFSDSCVKLWNIDQVKCDNEKGTNTDGIILSCEISLFYKCSLITFSNKCLYVGIHKKQMMSFNLDCKTGSSSDLNKFELKTGEFLSNFQVISKENSLIVIAICNDHTFIVIKHQRNEILFRSSVLSVNPVSCLTWDEYQSRLIIGTLAGELLYFSISLTGGAREIYRLRLYEAPSYGSASNSCSVIKSSSELSLPSPWEQKFEIMNIAQSEESKCGIVDLILFDKLDFLRNISEDLQYLGNVPIQMLAVSTQTGLFFLNQVSFEILSFNSWKSLKLCYMSNGRKQIKLYSLKNNLLTHDKSELTLDILNIDCILSKHYLPLKEKPSMICNEPLLPSSVLQKCLNLPSLKSSNLEPKKTNKNKRNSIDHPLTFKTKVKSSGYAKIEPKREFFKPITNSNSLKQKEPNKFMTKLKQDYTSDGFTKIKAIKKTKLDAQFLNLFSLRVSNYGDSLACCLSNGSCHIIDSKSQNAKQVIHSFDDIIQNVHWSLEDKYLILTNKNSVDIYSVVQNRKLLSSEKSSDEKSLNLLDGRFYSLDRFFHFTCGRKFKLMNYALDENREDIERYKNNSKVKCVYEWSSSDNNQITASVSINQFYSYMIIIGSGLSDSRLTLLDLNKMNVIEEKQSCHNRKIDRIVVNQGSLYSNISPVSFNCYASSSDSGVKLWDIRMKNCTQFYPKPKISSRYSNSIQFTPCGQILCICMDESIHFYDIRSTKFVCDIRSNTETYTDFTCSPRDKMVKLSR